LRYLQELLPYCPQFYTHNIGKEILAELKTTGHGTDKDVEMNIPQTQKEPIELKMICHKIITKAVHVKL
jgi:hypothetical protein